MLKVVIDKTIGETPAAVSQSEGIIYINPIIYNRLTDFEKKFVILHEMGHYYLNTRDEIKADAYAFSVLAGTEFQSLKKSVATIDNTLLDSNSTKAKRLHAMKTLVLQWDYENGNTAVKEELDLMQDMIPFTLKVFGVELFKTDSAKEKLRLQEAAYIAAQIEDLQASNRILEKNLTSKDTKKQTYIVLGILVFVFSALLFKGGK